MQTFNIHEAKTQLSKLIENAVHGESFIIAKSGKPMVKVIAVSAPIDSQFKKVGFLSNKLLVPDDFDTLGNKEIEVLFGVAN